MDVRNSVFPILMKAFVTDLMGDFLTGNNVPEMPTAEVMLFSAVAGSLNPNTSVSDLTPASFGGYAVKPLTSLVGPVLLPNGSGQGLIASLIWVATASPTDDVILGYGVVLGGLLLIAEQFAVPSPISAVGDSLVLNFTLPITFGQRI